MEYTYVCYVIQKPITTFNAIHNHLIIIIYRDLDSYKGNQSLDTFPSLFTIAFSKQFISSDFCRLLAIQRSDSHLVSQLSTPMSTN